MLAFTHSFIFILFASICASQSTLVKAVGKVEERTALTFEELPTKSFSSDDLDIMIDSYLLKTEGQGLIGVRKWDKMQGILGEGAGNQEMNLTLLGQLKYSYQEYCVLF